MGFPDGYGAGTRCPQPVSLIDLAPTILDLAGVEGWLPMDGRIVLPCIEGKELDRFVLKMDPILEKRMYSAKDFSVLIRCHKCYYCLTTSSKSAISMSVR